MEAVEATANTLDVPEAPAAPFARVNSYGESSIEYVVRVWTSNANYWTVYFDLIENIKIAFDNNGVEMTYNHLNVHMKEK